MSDAQSDAQKLWSMIKHIRCGMFTHRGANNMLHSHPLTTQNKAMDEGATLYFFISRTSEIASQIVHDDHVNISYTDSDKDIYVSVSGRALIVEDMGKKEALWSAMAKTWFAGGPTDPHLALLQVHISQAEYWSAQESRMVQVVKMVTAAITGTPPTRMGEHKALNIS